MSNWESFWSSNPDLFGTVMEKNAAFFVEILMNKNLIKSEDSILDYGCGFGSLANQLKNRVGAYIGVDISEKCIHYCQQKFKETRSFHFTTIDSGGATSGLTELIDQSNKFDAIIILSVIQYFPNLDKVENLLKDAKKLLSPGGKIILADVIQSEKGLWKDAYSNLKNSIQKRYFLSFMQFMMKARFSNYNKFRIRNNLLNVSETEIARICRNLELHYELLPVCTLQQSRVSYCITL